MLHVRRENRKLPRLMAGQFCFCGDVGRGIDGGVGEDAGGGLVGGVGGVLFVVDGDVGEQGAVENASYGWFTLAGALTLGCGHVESSMGWRKRDDHHHGQEELLDG
ncbi:MAG: hypothetical protein E6Z04_05370, partial [Cutibacterium avidum]|nr:hypothetical protein [Cutibacterium avidum]